MPVTANDVAFLGMRASADFTVTGQRPRNWREAILRLYPNGKAPLTALLALMKEESTNDPEFNWFCKILPSQAAECVGVWTDEGLATANAANGTIGMTLYLQMTEDHARQFVPNHTVLLRNNELTTTDTVAIVEDVVLAGTKSCLRVKLLQASTVPLSAANVQRVLIVGSAHAEGAHIGQAISYDPYRQHNYTQIFRNALEITRTAKKTHLRTGDAYKEAKRECLELHSIEMEKAFLFGVPSENKGANGKPLRTTGGIIWSIKQNGGFVQDFAGDWEKDGLDWLDELLMQIFRYGETDKLAYVGDAALLGINRLARKYGTWNYTPQTRAFGINIVELITPFGQITLKTHPLFSHEPTNQHSMLIFEPKNIKYRYITDTTFYASERETGHTRYDAQKEEYLTEAGLEYHFPQNWAWLNAVGKTTVGGRSLNVPTPIAAAQPVAKANVGGIATGTASTTGAAVTGVQK